jgi:2,6-dioxo-6-phenylhexa-3-enoate hydrolase
MYQGHNYAYSPFTPTPLEGIKALNKYWQEPTRENMKQIVALFIHDDKLKTDELVDRRHNAAISRPEHMEARRKSAAPLTDLIPIAHLVKAQTLIIWGREDRFSPLDHGLNLLARIQKSQFHMFPQCGHWCQYEKSDEFNRLVIDFLTHDH